jgi:hypothetical protein
MAIGFGLVIPTSSIAGVNPLTVGFAASVARTCLAYWAGVRRVLRDRDRRERDVLG